MVGLTRSLRIVDSEMYGTASGSESFFSSCLMGSAAASRGFVRIGETPKPPTDSSTMIASAKRTFWQGIFNPQASGLLASEGPVLILHDTTEFVYHREDVAAIGVLGDSIAGRDNTGRLRHCTVCGISMHSSLAVTLERAAAGPDGDQVLDERQVSRLQSSEEKDQSNARANREEGEHPVAGEPAAIHELLNDPTRCVHVGDRESDIYELFCTAQQLATHFLVRTCVDRLAGDGTRYDRQRNGAGTGSGSTSHSGPGQEGQLVHGPVGDSILPPRCLSTDWQAEELPEADSYCDPRHGARHTPRARQNRVEAAHGSAGTFTQRSHRKAGVVLASMEDRDFPQDTEVGLQSRGIKAENG
jgi:hypothetical protein